MSEDARNWGRVVVEVTNYEVMSEHFNDYSLRVGDGVGGREGAPSHPLPTPMGIYY